MFSSLFLTSDMVTIKRLQQKIELKFIFSKSRGYQMSTVNTKLKVQLLLASVRYIDVKFSFTEQVKFFAWMEHSQFYVKKLCKNGPFPVEFARVRAQRIHLWTSWSDSSQPNAYAYVVCIEVWSIVMFLTVSQNGY